MLGALRACFLRCAAAAQPAGAGAAQCLCHREAACAVSLDPVPRGKEFQAAVVVDIARGFHMNSHKPTDEYLIPTTLTPQLPAGFRAQRTPFIPKGRLEKFSFSPNKPLDVYTGSVTLKLRLMADAKAPLGTATIPVTLRYQACNDAACLPPVKVPVNVEVRVAAATAKAQPLHPEVFSSTGISNGGALGGACRRQRYSGTTKSG